MRYMAQMEYQTSGRAWRKTISPIYSFSANSEFAARAYLRRQLPKSARNMKILKLVVTEKNA